MSALEWLGTVAGVVLTVTYAVITVALYFYQYIAYTAMANPTGGSKELPREFRRKLLIESAKWPWRMIRGAP